MADEIINDHTLDEYASDLAADILADEGTADPFALAAEYADGSQWVIYYHKAHSLCANCNTDNGERYLEDTWLTEAGGLLGPPQVVTYNSLATIIAYGELRHRICEAIEAKQTPEGGAT